MITPRNLTSRARISRELKQPGHTSAAIKSPNYGRGVNCTGQLFPANISLQPRLSGPFPGQIASGEEPGRCCARTTQLRAQFPREKCRPRYRESASEHNAPGFFIGNNGAAGKSGGSGVGTPAALTGRPRTRRGSSVIYLSAIASPEVNGRVVTISPGPEPVGKAEIDTGKTPGAVCGPRGGGDHERRFPGKLIWRRAS